MALMTAIKRGLGLEPFVTACTVAALSQNTVMVRADQQPAQTVRAARIAKASINPVLDPADPSRAEVLHVRNHRDGGRERGQPAHL